MFSLLTGEILGSISNEGCVDEIYPCKTIVKVHEVHRPGILNKHERTSPFKCLPLSTSPNVSSGTEFS